MTMGQNPRTITAANSIVMYTVAGYYDTPLRMQGFQADNAFSFGDATVGETRIGVDGKQSGGWVAHEVPFTLFLEANSVSRTQVEDARAWCNANMETALWTFYITLPSTGKTYTISGFMVSQTGGTSAQKLLNGSQYVYNTILNGEESIS